MNGSSFAARSLKVIPPLTLCFEAGWRVEGGGERWLGMHPKECNKDLCSEFASHQIELL